MPKDKITFYEKDGKILLSEIKRAFCFIPTFWEFTFSFDSGKLANIDSTTGYADFDVSFYIFYGVYTGRIFLKTIKSEIETSNCDFTINKRSNYGFTIELLKPKNSNGFSASGKIAFCVDVFANYLMAVQAEKDLENNKNKFVPDLTFSDPGIYYPDYKKEMSCKLL